MANGMGCTRDLPGVESTGFSIAMRRGDILSTGRLMGTPANASRWIASIPSRPSTESIPTGVCRASPNCRCRWPSRKHRPTPANGATRDSICGPGPRDSRMRFYSSVNALLATVHSKIVRSRSVSITTTRCKSLRALFLRGAHRDRCRQGRAGLAMHRRLVHSSRPQPDRTRRPEVVRKSREVIPASRLSFTGTPTRVAMPMAKEMAMPKPIAVCRHRPRDGRSRRRAISARCRRRTSSR
ncbi:hypothetical protein QFZ96_000046 [Paraburkholderia youngii]